MRKRYFSLILAVFGLSALALGLGVDRSAVSIGVAKGGNAGVIKGDSAYTTWVGPRISEAEAAAANLERGEGWPTYLRAAMRAAIPVMFETGYCSGTAFRFQGEAFVMTAGHCTPLIKPRVEGVGDLVLAAGWPSKLDDVTVFLPADEGVRRELLGIAMDFITPGSEVGFTPASRRRLVCLGWEFISAGRRSRFQLVPLVGEVGPRFSFAEIFPLYFPEWRSVHLFSSAAWPGLSGSLCWGEDGLPKAMIVGGKTAIAPGVRVPLPPAVVEGPEIMTAVSRWLAERFNIRQN